MRPIIALALLTAALPTSGAGRPALAQPVELVSRVEPSLVPDSAGGDVRERAVSTDGRYVAFASAAPHLVAGVADDNDALDLFLHDRLLGTTTLVSHAAGDPSRAAGGESFVPRISAGGRFVAYQSDAPDLVAGQLDANGTVDVFLFDRTTGASVLASHAAGAATTAGNGLSVVEAISEDGGVVVYSSTATDLVAGQVDGNATVDVFRFHRATGTSALVSHAAGAATTTGNGVSLVATIDGAGTFVAFLSRSTNLVTGQVDANGAPDVFVHDTTSGDNLVASRAAGTTATTANGVSSDPRISRHGNQVVFSSTATDVVAGQVDANGATDVFQFRRLSTPVLVSSAAGSATTTANAASRLGLPSYDGARVVFASRATNVFGGQVDANGVEDVFLFERATGAKQLVSRRAGTPSTAGDGPSTEPQLSDDGLRVAFRSDASDLVAGQETDPTSSDLFRWDAAAGAGALVSHLAGDATAGAPGEVGAFAFSRDGAVVAYTAEKAGLVAEVDTNGVDDVFAWDATTAESELLTRRDPARPSATAGESFLDVAGMVSADGSFVVFESESPALVAGQVDRPRTGDVFLRDRSTGVTTLVSHVAGALATAAGASTNPRISADGAWVAFVSEATDLVPGQVDEPWTADVFLWERATGLVTLVSHAQGAPAVAADGYSQGAAPSADGRFVAFVSTAGDLAAVIDGNGGNDVFLYDRLAGTSRLVSHLPGLPSMAGDGASESPAITPSGDWITFTSAATDLATSDGNDAGDVFLWRRSNGQSFLVSHLAGDPEVTASGRSETAVASADGRWVAFASAAKDLVDGQADANDGPDVFLWDRLAASARLVSHRAGDPAAAGDGPSGDPALSADGGWVAFDSSATDLVPGQADDPDTSDVFLHERIADDTRLVSHRWNDPATAAGDSLAARLSGDGGVVAFLSQAPDLLAGQVDGAGERDAFVFRRDLGELVLASRRVGTSLHGGGSVYELGVSADGTTVVFSGGAGDLVTSDFNVTSDVFAFRPDPLLFADGFESGDVSAWGP